MRIPKHAIKEARDDYDWYVAQGYKPAQAWSWVMVNLKHRYHVAKVMAIKYAFITA